MQDYGADEILFQEGRRGRSRSKGDVLNPLGDVLNSLGVVLNSLGDVLNPLGDVLNPLGDVLNSLGDVLNSLGVVPFSGLSPKRPDVSEEKSQP